MSKAETTAPASLPSHRGWEDLWFFAPPTYAADAPPDPLAVSLAEQLARGSRVLDIGCGLGRNSIYLLRQGHRVTALDISPSALQVLRKEAQVDSTRLALILGSFTQLPLCPGAFDGALAVNVVYHATRQQIVDVVACVADLLTSGGWFMLNLLSKHHWQYPLYLEKVRDGKAREIEPGSFLAFPEHAANDMALPHHFHDLEELEQLFSGYEVMRLEESRGECAMGPTGRWIVHLRKPA